MDCVSASYAGVAGSSPTEMEQNFVPFSFYHNPPNHYLKKFILLRTQKPTCVSSGSSTKTINVRRVFLYARKNRSSNEINKPKKISEDWHESFFVGKGFHYVRVRNLFQLI